MNNKICTLLLAMVVPSSAISSSANDFLGADNYYNTPFLYDSLKIPHAEVKLLSSNPIFSSAHDTDESAEDNYSSGFPVSAKQSVSEFEARALPIYLSNPADIQIIELLAIYCLKKSILNNTIDSESLRYTIIAQYFLERSLVLRETPKQWVSHSHKLVDRALHNHNASESVYQQDLQSHADFTHAFNYDESQRIHVINKLFEDYSAHPGNALTSAYLTAANIWVGGEADFSDPSILYNFILSSYFSVRSVAMSETLEKLWFQDPENYSRVRLAPILGGWTVPARRWLAQLHGDTEAVETLDAEHDQWFNHYPAFHAASIGLMYFNEPEHVLQGWDAWWTGFGHCMEVPTIRSCLDRPRFSFNNLSYFLGAVDYMIKLGELDMAAQFLTLNQNPAFGWSSWDYGRDAWNYRQANLQEIFDLYQNENPSDDPTNFLLKKHKWGSDTITCQYCHQAQSREWSEQDISTVYLPDESIATLYNWPDITTSWFSASRASPGNCSGIATWSSETPYTAKDIVVWKGAKYSAKWWNFNENPNNSNMWDVWTFEASCHSGIH